MTTAFSLDSCVTDMASAVVLPMSREVKNLVPEHSSSTLLELQLRSAKQPLIIFLLIPLDKKYYMRPIQMFTVNSGSFQKPGRLLTNESKLHRTILQTI